MSFKAGFITPPWSHTRGDSISALSLISRIEKEAHHGSGSYYEIYHYRVMNELMGVADNLNTVDAETFREVAASSGYHLNVRTMHESSQAFNETMAEIRRDQI